MNGKVKIKEETAKLAKKKMIVKSVAQKKESEFESAKKQGHQERFNTLLDDAVFGVTKK